MNIGQTGYQAKPKMSFKAAQNTEQAPQNYSITLPELALIVRQRQLQIAAAQEIAAPQARVAAPLEYPSSSTIKRHIPMRAIGIGTAGIAALVIGSKVVPAMFSHEQPATNRDVPTIVQPQSFNNGYNMALTAETVSGDFYNSQFAPERIAQLKASGGNAIERRVDQTFIYPTQIKDAPPAFVDIRTIDEPEERAAAVENFDRILNEEVAPQTRSFIIEKTGQQPMIGADGQPTVGVQFRVGYTTKVPNKKLLHMPNYSPIADLKPR